ncbi:hypothetical protein FQR65_LT19502 [Abscondita terminalis]|nr:hypothetical protein FQR65_LT19502 [Abscondita terminalis]
MDHQSPTPVRSNSLSYGGTASKDISDTITRPGRSSRRAEANYAFPKRRTHRAHPACSNNKGQGCAGKHGSAKARSDPQHCRLRKRRSRLGERDTKHRSREHSKRETPQVHLSRWLQQRHTDQPEHVTHHSREHDHNHIKAGTPLQAQIPPDSSCVTPCICNLTEWQNRYSHSDGIPSQLAQPQRNEPEFTASRSSRPRRTAQASHPARPRRALRADIQALRAIAVLLVVVNHLWPTRLPGGYVGVDVFFVVSGFLISAHLLKEVTATGRVRLGTILCPSRKAALARRVSRHHRFDYRHAPAHADVPVEEAAFEAFAASAYYLNWLLAANSVDYSASTTAATVVQHYWSLSVEEQFYLVWPLAPPPLTIGAVLGQATRLRKQVQTCAHGGDPHRGCRKLRVCGGLNSDEPQRGLLHHSKPRLGVCARGAGCGGRQAAARIHAAAADRASSWAVDRPGRARGLGAAV